MPKYLNKTVIHCCSALGIVCCVIFVVYGLRHHLFTSQEALRSFMAGFGAMGVVVFVFFQAVQVVIPILPGGLGCLAGVLLFGPWTGFLCNYAGICAGSIAAFLLARLYGKPVLSVMFRQETIAKYEAWTGKHFTKWFAVAIFLPVAPDDFLCWLAGTTRMTLRTFTTIILLGKPGAIALYSIGLQVVFGWLAALVPAI